MFTKVVVRIFTFSKGQDYVTFKKVMVKMVNCQKGQGHGQIITCQ